MKNGVGSLMFWDSFSPRRIESFVRVEGIMKQDQYVKFLRENLKEFVETFDMGSGMLFQYDKDPMYTAKSV